jgi:hypothetical protein
MRSSRHFDTGVNEARRRWFRNIVTRHIEARAAGLRAASKPQPGAVMAIAQAGALSHFKRLQYEFKRFKLIFGGEIGRGCTDAA